MNDLGEKAAERMNSFAIDKVLSQLGEIIFQEDLNGAEIKD